MSNIKDQYNRLKQLEKEKDIELNAWRGGLIRNSKGIIENNIDNYILYLSESDEYKDKLKYNEFLQQKEFDGREFRDEDEAVIAVNCERNMAISSHVKIKDALGYVFSNNTYNPVKDYLNTLEWDGEKRIEEVFIKCFDIRDTELVRVLSKKWFIAAVKRVFDPGCQFDNMIVLQGATGIGKTTFCRLISKNFYSEIKFDDIGNKDTVDKLNKSWIVIIDEMDNFGKKEMAGIKSFLSVRKDVTRLAYGHNTRVYERHCIFIGSLNDETFLKDITTSVERRFWIFKCREEKMSPFISNTLTDDYVDQLWAESMYYYRQNPEQYLDIESEYQEEFARDQLQYKTFNTDVTIDYVNEILNKPYILVNGQFNDDNDFLRQYRDDTVYPGQRTYINKIKISSVLYVLKEVYHIQTSGKYIGLALSKDWYYKNYRWGNSTPFTLIRKNENSQVIDSDQVNNALFFGQNP